MTAVDATAVDATAVDDGCRCNGCRYVGYTAMTAGGIATFIDGAARARQEEAWQKLATRLVYHS